MALNGDVRRALLAAAETLSRRARSAVDAAERVTLREVIESLRRAAGALPADNLLAAAEAVAVATAELERAVAAVRHGPFDGYLAALEKHFAALNRLSGRLHRRDALGRAPVKGTGKDQRRATRGRDLGPAPLNSRNYADLAAEYQRFFDECSVRPECHANVAYYVKRLQQGQPNYAQLEAELGIPWQFVGVIHGMECGFNFYGHLHNGDPLTARTVHVPKGLPREGAPPFAWRDSATDALKLRKLDAVTDWSPAHMLYLLEGYNGFGYRAHGVPTPYLWSFSNVYESGKFTQDGKFDAAAVSKQCGAALMLKAVL